VFDGSALLDPTPAEQKARVGARRSIFTVNDIPQGDLLNPSDIVMLRPGGGLEPWQADDYLYRPLAVDVPAGVALTKEMF
jgi:sialic acid synthase SpsE